MAKSYGIRTAKAHFSELVGRVGAGDEVVITARGKAVAKLVPMDTVSAAQSVDAAWARAAAEGWVEPPSRPRAKHRPLIELQKRVDLAALVRSMRR